MPSTPGGPTITIQGMDVDSVRALAAELGGAGDRLQRIGTAVSSSVTGSWWCGRDADDFRASWRRHRTTLEGAASLLRETRSSLLRQAHEQEVASGASGQPGGPAAALFGPLGPMVDGARDRLGELGGDAVDWLEWLAGPEGPSTEDATKLVPGLQETMGDVMDAVMQHTPLSGLITSAFGFQYVPGADFYTTNEHSVQSRLGFHDLYDRIHKLGGMDLDEQVIEFPANGQQYRLELWKGGYGSGGAFGGEIGLYTRRPDSTGLRGLLEHIPGYYSSAQEADQIPMTQTIYNKVTGEQYFTNEGQGAPDGDHYWNLAIRTDPGIRREDLGQIGTLHVADPNVRAAMAQAMRDEGLSPVVDDVAGTVRYTWEG